MKFFDAARAATVMVVLAGSAGAGTNLVTNGGFESTTNGPGQLGYNTNATDWTAPAGGYTFLFASGGADTTGASGSYGGLTLWGPNDGSANGLPAASPDGGNFVALDGDFQDQPLQQTINGLVSGKTYEVSFYYAFSQQYGFTGATTQNLSVNLGGSYSGDAFTGGTTLTTADYNLPSHGFSGWMQDNLKFTATGTSEVLSFLAYGSQPVPPFALLDGVSMTAVPEPADWALLLLGVGAVGGVARLRRRATAPNAAV
jgi:hypothetical protein